MLGDMPCTSKVPHIDTTTEQLPLGDTDHSSGLCESCCASYSPPCPGYQLTFQAMTAARRTRDSQRACGS